MFTTAAKRRRGYTLLEAVTALAVWLLIAAGTARLLVYSARVSTRILGEHEAFENARAALDALAMNVQMADTLVLETNAQGGLKKLTLTERSPAGTPANYIFYFNAAAQPGEAKYHRLEFGLNDEFASYIADIVLSPPHDGAMTITVVTDDRLSPPITLTQSADVRYKQVSVR